MSDFYYWILFLDSLLLPLALCGNQLMDFYCNSTDWLVRYAGPYRIENFRTAYRIFFSSRVRFSLTLYVIFINFNDSFNFEIREVFNVTSFCMYCFYSTINCSFVVFGSFRLGIVLNLLLMHGLKKAFEQTEI